MEGCRRFCSELHVCCTSTDIINVTIARKILWCRWGAESINEVRFCSCGVVLQISPSVEGSV
jgi:hypothetical protein